MKTGDKKKTRVRHECVSEGEAVAKPEKLCGDSAAKIEAAILRRIDAALRAEIEANGPLLLWSGEGGFPRDECRFRGLSVGAGRHAGRLGGLPYWLGVKPRRKLAGEVRP